MAYWPGIFSCVVPIMENKTVKILIGAKLMLAKDKWGEESKINIVTLETWTIFIYINVNNKLNGLFIFCEDSKIDVCWSSWEF